MNKKEYAKLLIALTDGVNYLLTEISNGHQAIEIRINGNHASIVRHSGEVISNGETFIKTHHFLTGMTSALMITSYKEI